MTNFQRTASWLKACGKEPSSENLSVQIGCHIEEFLEFLTCLEFYDGDNIDEARVTIAVELLEVVANRLKRKYQTAVIPVHCRHHALDALCDSEVTGNGVAYLAEFKKEAADAAVLDANDAKLVDGKPVILDGGKIGKPAGWTAADLRAFV